MSQLDGSDIPRGVAATSQPAVEYDLAQTVNKKWQKQKGEETAMAMQIHLHLPELGLSIVDNRPQELVYISAKQVHLRYTSREILSTPQNKADRDGVDQQQQTVQHPNLTAQEQERRDGGDRELNQQYYAAVGHLQMDNMDRHSHFPVAFTSSLPSYSTAGGDTSSQARGTEERPPFLSMKFDRSVHPINEHIKNFEVLMQVHYFTRLINSLQTLLTLVDKTGG